MSLVFENAVVKSSKEMSLEVNNVIFSVILSPECVLYSLSIFLRSYSCKILMGLTLCKSSFSLTDAFFAFSPQTSFLCICLGFDRSWGTWIEVL